jgi:hypothetical protein
VQLKVQIRELLAFASRQSGEQALWHCGKICLELADAHEVLVMCIWRIIVLAGDEVVFHHERLTRAEVASIVERDWFVGRDWSTLVSVLAAVTCLTDSMLDVERKYLCNVPLHPITDHPPFPERTPISVGCWVFLLVEDGCVAGTVGKSASALLDNTTFDSA